MTSTDQVKSITHRRRLDSCRLHFGKRKDRPAPATDPGYAGSNPPQREGVQLESDSGRRAPGVQGLQAGPQVAPARGPILAGMPMRVRGKSGGARPCVRPSLAERAQVPTATRPSYGFERLGYLPGLRRSRDERKARQNSSSQRTCTSSRQRRACRSSARWPAGQVKIWLSLNTYPSTALPSCNVGSPKSTPEAERAHTRQYDHGPIPTPTYRKRSRPTGALHSITLPPRHQPTTRNRN